MKTTKIRSICCWRRRGARAGGAGGVGRGTRAQRKNVRKFTGGQSCPEQRQLLSFHIYLEPVTILLLSSSFYTAWGTQPWGVQGMTKVSFALISSGLRETGNGLFQALASPCPATTGQKDKRALPEEDKAPACTNTPAPGVHDCSGTTVALTPHLRILKYFSSQIPIFKTNPYCNGDPNHIPTPCYV